jgi:hypothetical protein
MLTIGYQSQKYVTVEVSGHFTEKSKNLCETRVAVSVRLHGTTSQKTVIFIFAAMRTETSQYLCDTFYH